MSTQRVFPFRRVSVDQMIRGVTRVWWQLEPTYNEPGERIFQLQVGNTPLHDAEDWRNVGSPITDGYVAYDEAWRDSAGVLLSHYRVTLTTPNSLYVSQPVACFGELSEKDWLLAREIIRKEQLRHSYVSTPGYLLKPYRFGRPCRRCRDPLTQEVLDANCPTCNGTSFEVGYHPPLALQCWDLSPQLMFENQDITMKGTTREDAEVTARVIGFPSLTRNDIWVNGSTDERWLVHKIQVTAAIRGVPLVCNVSMGLIPFIDNAYKLEIGGEPSERPGPVPPDIGCGAVTVDHDYGGADALAYIDAADCAVVGADVYAFSKDTFDAASPDYPARDEALAHTSTTANGRWAEAINLDPGDYVLLFEKYGEYGPDTVEITITSDEVSDSYYPEPAGGASGDDLLRTPSTTIWPGPCPPDTADFWNF